MVITLEHGITKVSDALLCQELEIQDKVEYTKVLGMVAGAAQVKHTFPHTREISGTVKGHGPLTITPGVGEAGVAGVSGGVTLIETVKYKEGIQAASDWEYNWFNFPHAQPVA